MTGCWNRKNDMTMPLISSVQRMFGAHLCPRQPSRCQKLHLPPFRRCLSLALDLMGISPGSMKEKTDWEFQSLIKLVARMEMRLPCSRAVCSLPERVFRAITGPCSSPWI